VSGGNQVARTAQRTIIDTTVDPSQRNDRWLTPPDVVKALGVFDLDPCGAPGHVLARVTFLQEDGADGLTDPWFGRVWMNPPYGRTMRQWVERLVEHGTGTALVPVAACTKLWQEVVFREASAVRFYRHRIKFIRRDGKDDDMVSPQASAIVAFGNQDADALLVSGLPGVVFDLRSAQTSDEGVGEPAGGLAAGLAEPLSVDAPSVLQGARHGLACGVGLHSDRTDDGSLAGDVHGLDLDGHEDTVLSSPDTARS
jgi:hypothetical protein